MRYYDITISNSDPARGPIGVVTIPYLNTPGTTYTNFVGNQIVNGLDVEMQIRNMLYGSTQGAPQDGSFVTIYGVSLAEVSQSLNLNGLDVVVRGGMQKGLPLAKPEQNGILAYGRIFQSIGNWEGIDKTLTLMIFAFPTRAQNFQFIWKQGTPMKPALELALATAYPDYQITVLISPQLIARRDVNATYYSPSSFAEAIKKYSQDPYWGGLQTLPGLGVPYAGVNITSPPTINSSPPTGTTFPQPTTTGLPPVPGTPNATLSNGKSIMAFDLTVPYTANNRSVLNPILLDIEDFIGQPSWIEPQVIRFKTVMRADIRVGDYVKFPSKPFGNLFAVVTPQAAFPNVPSRNALAFDSSYFIRRVTSYGRLRSPDPSSWSTVFEAVFMNVSLENRAPGGGRGTGVQGPI